MKNSAILCAAVATALGFSTLASAQDARQERQAARQDARQDARQERRQDARQDRQQAARMPNYVNQPLANVRDPEPFEQRRYNNNYGQRGYNNNYAQHGYNNYGPQHYGNGAPRFYRGGYLPYSYRQPTYYVSWRAHRGLYAPPYGYQWVHVGNDFLLIALATGLITTTITM